MTVLLNGSKAGASQLFDMNSSTLQTIGGALVVAGVVVGALAAGRGLLKAALLIGGGLYLLHETGASLPTLSTPSLQGMGCGGRPCSCARMPLTLEGEALRR